VFVAAVEAHRLAEEACADADPDPVFHKEVSDERNDVPVDPSPVRRSDRQRVRRRVTGAPAMGVSPIAQKW
jgi:hypothetical protein